MSTTETGTAPEGSQAAHDLPCLDPPALVAPRAAPSDAPPPHELEVLFREARRRSRRRRLIFASSAIAAAALLVVALALASSGVGSSAARRTATTGTVPVGSVRLLSCSGSALSSPTTFVISCADGNAELTATHWTSWSATDATGTTLFGLNLCTPDCAASRISFFPRSTVRLSDPMKTKRGLLFSKLEVVYTSHGKRKAFTFSWSGDPSF